MKTKAVFGSWQLVLVQGIIMIALSFIIFNNPDVILAALALWLGVGVIVAGLVGMIAYFAQAKENRDSLALLGSVAIAIIGVVMISKMFATMKAITFIFGLLVAIIGLLLVWGSFSGRKHWPSWWLITILGIAALVMGIKSIMDIYAGAQNISTLIGISVLLSGIGLVGLAFLKKKVAQAIRGTVKEIKEKAKDR